MPLGFMNEEDAAFNGDGIAISDCIHNFYHFSILNGSLGAHWGKWHESKNKCWMDQALSDTCYEDVFYLSNVCVCFKRVILGVRVCVWAFYLRVGHASKAILRASLRTPAAHLLGHLLSTSCHPWMTLRDPPFHRPKTHTQAHMQSSRHTFN